MIALIDTNVLVRFLTAAPETQYKNLLNFFKELEHGNIHIELKLIVLFQTLFVLQSFYKVEKESIAEALLALIEFKGITIRDKKIVKKMLSFWVENNLEIVDCYLIACLEGDKQNILYSYDKDFDKFKIARKEP
ncbi:MAG: PIN domain-containing protein [Pseudomonadota bacterium]